MISVCFLLAFIAMWKQIISGNFLILTDRSLEARKYLLGNKEKES